ncbi:uncharacterized protein C2845_PM11G24530 [Panicum miliaceum]|uniref:Bifunctional inhibitor/plant lipid transfer protein/seed storage helical domain-containing protein n=1 Tax=Panicum miliaceum TaxID=4540 RepID=A0A3L6RQU3_PANMI|nr:uncharacterized protein C2845_PM11G24530 [Panicum miliaceum]
MKMKARAVVLLSLSVLALAMLQAGASDGDKLEAMRRRYRRRRGRDQGLHRSSPPPTPPPPSPLCNRTIGPDMAADENLNCPSPPPPPPTPPHVLPPCFCPRPPAFRRPPPGNGAGASSPLECVSAMAGLMSCGSFVTGSQEETPTPQSDCCIGLRVFFNSTSAAGDGGRTLRCLCPVILGDVNKVLPKAVDPVRLMYLPIACGIVLPPQTLFMCFTGHPNPTVVERFSELWDNGPSSPAPATP